MNYILLIIYSNILLTFSPIQTKPIQTKPIQTKPIKPTKPKLCVDCKFFRKDFFDQNKFGKCSLFPQIDDNDYFLIDGYKSIKNTNYNYCVVSRKYDNMCGKEGKLYEKK